MKTNSISKIITICFAILILYSCESHVKKADDDFTLYKENKMQQKEIVPITKEITPEPKKIVQESKKIDPEPKRMHHEKKSVNLDAWTIFKSQTIEKICANETEIEKLRNSPTANAKMLKKVSALEKENNDFRRQMDEYNQKMKVSFENFKTAINHHVDEIDIKLKDIDTQK